MKLKIIVLNIVLAILIVTFLYSALNVDVEVLTTRASYTLEGDNLLISMPVSVRNGGFYPLKNIRVETLIENGTSCLWKDVFTINEIAPLSTYTEKFILKINITSVYEELGSKFALNGGELTLKILIHGEDWMLAEMNAVEVRKIWWEPLIESFNILTSQIKFENESIMVPYILKPRVPVNGKINLIIQDAEGIIAKGQEDILCGKVATVKLNLQRDMTELTQEEWEIIAVLSVGSLKITKQVSYEFTPDIGGGVP